MHKLPLLLLLAFAAASAHPGPSLAQQAMQPASRSIGTWGDWEAFTLREADATACYARARPFSSVPALAEQGEPMLTVTRRPGKPDTVTAASGRPEAIATAEMRVGSALFPFGTGPGGAAARDGAAAVAAMKRGLQAIMRFEAPGSARGSARAADTYSLRGFRGAYEAMRRACPAR